MKKLNGSFWTLLFSILLITTNAYALKIVSLNTEWLWDASEPHEGQVVGYKDSEKIKPPTPREFVLETYAIAKLIESLDADIVGLIEIENENVAQSIQQYLDEKWHVVFVQGRDTTTGQDVAILTRLDIISGTATNFPDYVGESKDGSIKKRPSKVLGVGLKENGRSYFVVVAHLISQRGQNDSKRFAQADAIRDAVVDQYTQFDHFIVMGDMNDFPDSDAVKRLKGLWDDHDDLVQTADSADYSYVYKGRKQLIDHILVDKNLSENGSFSTVGLPEEITDHRAVVFELR